MNDLNTTQFERFRYWQGQMLRSRDFRDQANIEAQLRWWHNRALHTTHGVSLGLEVSYVFESNSSPAVTDLYVRPGVAYDCHGRALILQSRKEISVPQEPPSIGNTKTLVLRYKKTSQYPPKQEISGDCLETEGSQFLEEPIFEWWDSNHYDFKQGVPLARVIYRQFPRHAFKPVRDEEFYAFRARAIARPRTASGATIAGNTAWESWEESNSNIGLQVKIDTSAAGFTDTPCYFAWLQGPLWSTSVNSRGEPELSEFFPAPLTHIHNPMYNEFTFRLWGPAFGVEWLRDRMTTNEQFTSRFLSFAQKKRLFVNWLGIQPLPSIDL